MRNPYEREGLYIAGPACFYLRGYDLWWAQRKLAEYHGIPVVLPTSTALRLDNEDKGLNAKEIFDDLVVQVERTTAIIADLENFRGVEPDGGTIFEMGWIWARGGRVYGYSHDSRTMASKNPNVSFDGKILRDQNGSLYPFADLQFCPSVMASTRIVNGGFDDALSIYMMDLDESRKGHCYLKENIPNIARKAKKTIYLSSRRRYEEDNEWIEEKKQQAEAAGYVLLSPSDDVVELPRPETDDSLSLACWQWQKQMALLRASDIIIADLNNYHGWEPNNDVSFECGAAYGWGKKCIAYSQDVRKMQERIPNDNGIDWCGNVVENFDLPMNLMFGCTFSIAQGEFSEALSMINMK